MRVLIGCECSGAVRRAFRANGHDAWSCDLKPAEDNDPHHYLCDMFEVIDAGWDLGIFHPTCRYLANSGSKHLYKGMKLDNGPDELRWQNMREGAEFFRRCLKAGIPRVAVENPIMHRHARAIVKIPYAQIIQPWEYGHKEMKATCLWLKGLPRLQPTDIVGPPPEDRIERRAWAVVHREPPGPEREANRSRTYAGIAAAMAEQWGE